MSDPGGEKLPAVVRKDASLKRFQTEKAMMERKIERDKREIDSLRARLVRRGYLLDSIRKAYLRDVVVVAEELNKTDGYKASSGIKAVPSCDLSKPLNLFR